MLCANGLRRVVGMGVAGSALLYVAACNAVLGIEERTFDACQTYCDTIQAACTGDLQQYQNAETCLGACALFEAGDFDDPRGNTLACRINQALAARNTGEPDLHCPLAGLVGMGPAGEAECVQDQCQVYCEFMTTVCAGSSPLGEFEECRTDCASVPNNPKFGPVDVKVKDYDDSIQCRSWHLAVATTNLVHCSHADGSAKCNGMPPP